MKYSATLTARICTLLATGEHTIADVCKQVGISEETFYSWKREKPEFSEALKKVEEQRLEAYRRMALSGLAKTLDVYEYEEVTTEYADDGKGKPKVKSRKVTKKKVMPNVAAIIYTLNNRDPHNWQQRKHVELSGQVQSGGQDLSKLSDQELEQYLALARKMLPDAPAT
jgi:transposase-like protein